MDLACSSLFFVTRFVYNLLSLIGVLFHLKPEDPTLLGMPFGELRDKNGI